MRARLMGVVWCVLTLAATDGTAWATTVFSDLFTAAYQTRGTALDSCRVCHQNPSGGRPLNGYGTAFRDAGAEAAALKSIEALDSDRDTFSNLVEINGRSFPGDFASAPLSSINGQMARPVSGQSAFTVRADVLPIVTTDPVTSIPFGFGLITLGADQFRLHVGLPPFNGAVDVYLALMAPSLVGPEVLILAGRGNQLSLEPLSSAGLVPWISGGTGPLDAVLIPDTSLCCSPAQCPANSVCLPGGTYTFLLAVTPSSSLNTFYVWASDFTVGPRDLLLRLRDMAPNVSPPQVTEVRVVSNANVLMSKAILDPLPSADFDLRMPGAVPPGLHRVDFFADLNLNRTYNAPPVDQAWRVILVPTGTVDLTFAHSTAFADIGFPPVTEKGTLTLTLSSMADYVRRLMEFRVIKAATEETVGYYRLNAVAANSLTVRIPGIIENGVDYRVDFYADVNDSKTYNAPPTDHAWRLTGRGGTQGLSLNFVRTATFTDIGF